MRLEPKHSCCGRRINPDLRPPDRFITTAMDLAVMASAEWDREFITDLATEGKVLCEPQMVGVGRLATANQTSLLRHVSDVIPVTNPPWLREGEGAFVDCPCAPFPLRPPA
jgi:hypothetical protein